MSSFTCPFTGKVHLNEDYFRYSDNHRLYGIPIELKSNDTRYFWICSYTYDMLKQSNKEFLQEFNKVKNIIFFEFINENMDALGGSVLHWKCRNAEGQFDQLILIELVNNLELLAKYPRIRCQKAENLLNYLYDNQNEEGSLINILDNPGFWGNLFFNSYKEMTFYLEQLRDQKHVKWDKEQHMAGLTFDGIDKVERMEESSRSLDQDYLEEKFDIGLSFAGEEREFVDEVAKELRARDVKVFYDKDSTRDLWGKDLYQYLNDIYKNKCEYCIIFVSKSYAKKLFPKHELKAAQAKAFNESKEYILPVRFDETELPGMNNTTHYLHIKDYTPKQIAELAVAKLKTSMSII